MPFKMSRIRSCGKTRRRHTHIHTRTGAISIPPSSASSSCSICCCSRGRKVEILTENCPLSKMFSRNLTNAGVVIPGNQAVPVMVPPTLSPGTRMGRARTIESEEVRERGKMRSGCIARSLEHFLHSLHHHRHNDPMYRHH